MKLKKRIISMTAVLALVLSMFAGFVPALAVELPDAGEGHVMIGTIYYGGTPSLQQLLVAARTIPDGEPTSYYLATVNANWDIEWFDLVADPTRANPMADDDAEIVAKKAAITHVDWTAASEEPGQGTEEPDGPTGPAVTATASEGTVFNDVEWLIPAAALTAGAKLTLTGGWQVAYISGDAAALTVSANRREITVAAGANAFNAAAQVTKNGEVAYIGIVGYIEPAVIEAAALIETEDDAIDMFGTDPDSAWDWAGQSIEGAQWLVLKYRAYEGITLTAATVTTKSGTVYTFAIPQAGVAKEAGHHFIGIEAANVTGAAPDETEFAEGIYTIAVEYKFGAAGTGAFSSELRVGRGDAVMIEAALDDIDEAGDLELKVANPAEATPWTNKIAAVKAAIEAIIDNANIVVTVATTDGAAFTVTLKSNAETEDVTVNATFTITAEAAAENTAVDEFVALVKAGAAAWDTDAATTLGKAVPAEFTITITAENYATIKAFFANKTADSYATWAALITAVQADLDAKSEAAKVNAAILAVLDIEWDDEDDALVGTETLATWPTVKAAVEAAASENQYYALLTEVTGKSSTNYATIALLVKAITDAIAAEAVAEDVEAVIAAIEDLVWDDDADTIAATIGTALDKWEDVKAAFLNATTKELFGFAVDVVDGKGRADFETVADIAEAIEDEVAAQAELNSVDAAIEAVNDLQWDTNLAKTIGTNLDDWKATVKVAVGRANQKDVTGADISQALLEAIRAELATATSADYATIEELVEAIDDVVTEKAEELSVQAFIDLVKNASPPIDTAAKLTAVKGWSEVAKVLATGNTAKDTNVADIVTAISALTDTTKTWTAVATVLNPVIKLADAVAAAKTAVAALFADPAKKDALAAGVNQDAIDAAQLLITAATTADTGNAKTAEIDAIQADLDAAQTLLNTQILTTALAAINGAADAAAMQTALTANGANAGLTMTDYTALSNNGKLAVATVVYDNGSNTYDAGTLASAFNTAVAEQKAIEDANADITAAKALITGDLNPIFNTDENFITKLNAISGMSALSVVITLDATANAAIADNGTITYGAAPVNGNVIVKINKGTGVEQTITLSITVPVDTEKAALAAINAAYVIVGESTEATGTWTWGSIDEATFVAAGVAGVTDGNLADMKAAVELVKRDALDNATAANFTTAQLADIFVHIDLLSALSAVIGDEDEVAFTSGDDHTVTTLTLGDGAQYDFSGINFTGTVTVTAAKTSVVEIYGVTLTEADDGEAGYTFGDDGLAITSGEVVIEGTLEDDLTISSGTVTIEDGQSLDAGSFDVVGDLVFGDGAVLEVYGATITDTNEDTTVTLAADSINITAGTCTISGTVTEDLTITGGATATVTGTLASAANDIVGDLAFAEGAALTVYGATITDGGSGDTEVTLTADEIDITAGACTISGTVTENLTITGDTVTVTGTLASAANDIVGDLAFAEGAALTVYGATITDGGSGDTTVTLAADEIDITAGTCTISGTVTENLTISGGTVTIDDGQSLDAGSFDVVGDLVFGDGAILTVYGATITDGGSGDTTVTLAADDDKIEFTAGTSTVTGTVTAAITISGGKVTLPVETTTFNVTGATWANKKSGQVSGETGSAVNFNESDAYNGTLTITNQGAVTLTKPTGQSTQDTTGKVIYLSKESGTTDIATVTVKVAEATHQVFSEIVVEIL